eukprot:248042-Rhodomonas_salina.1
MAGSRPPVGLRFGWGGCWGLGSNVFGCDVCCGWGWCCSGGYRHAVAHDVHGVQAGEQSFGRYRGLARTSMEADASRNVTQ